MKPVNPRGVPRKRWEILKGHSAARSMEVALHPESGSRISETAEERQIRFEKFNRPW
jgi:hypothetical protein